MTDGRPALSSITNILPRFRRTYSGREITAGASAFSRNCISGVLAPGAPDDPGRLGGKVDADRIAPAPGADARRRERRVGRAGRVPTYDRAVEACMAPDRPDGLFDVRVYLLGGCRVAGNRPRLPDRKVHRGGQLERPAGPYVAPNLSRIAPVTTMAVQDPRSKPPSVGLCRRMPSSARIWSPERRRGRPGLLRSCLRSWPLLLHPQQPAVHGALGVLGYVGYPVQGPAPLAELGGL